MDLLGLLANAAGGLQRGRQQPDMQGWGNQQRAVFDNPAAQPGNPAAQSGNLAADQSGWGAWTGQMAKPIGFGADLGGSTPSGHFPTLQPPQQQQSPPLEHLENYLSQWFSQLPNLQQFGGLNWGAAAPWWQSISGNFGGK